MQFVLEILYGLVHWCTEDPSAMEQHNTLALAVNQLVHEACVAIWSCRGVLEQEVAPETCYLVYYTKPATLAVSRKALLYVITAYIRVMMR